MGLIRMESYTAFECIAKCKPKTMSRQRRGGYTLPDEDATGAKNEIGSVWKCLCNTFLITRGDRNYNCTRTISE